MIVRRFSVDGRSLVIGFLLGLCMILLLATGKREQAVPVGRYQLVSGEWKYVLDTVTGEVCAFRKYEKNTLVDGRQMVDFRYYGKWPNYETFKFWHHTWDYLEARGKDRERGTPE